MWNRQRSERKMAKTNSKQGQLEMDDEKQEASVNEPLSSAVRNLVESAIEEARVSRDEGGVITIEVEEEPVAVKNHSKQTTAGFAVSAVKSMTGAMLSATKLMANGVINTGKASAGAARKLATATANYVQEKGVIEGATNLLGSAESEGEEAVKVVTKNIGSFRGKI